MAFPMQWEGEVLDAPALLGLHRMGDAAPVLAKAPSGQHAEMLGYAGSVAVFDADRSVAISSPKGGQVQVFGTDGRFAYAIARPDVCGLSASASGLVMTDGLGAIITAVDGQPVAHQRANRAWDNHLIPV